MNVDGVSIVLLEVLRLFLGQSTTSNNLKSLLNAYSFLSTSFKVRQVSFTGAESLCLLGANLALAVFNINLVAQNDKWEVDRVIRVALNQKFVSPNVQSLKRLLVVDVVDKNAAIGTTVESNTQRLESLLACGIPKLQRHTTIV